MENICALVMGPMSRSVGPATRPCEEDTDHDEFIQRSSAGLPSINGAGLGMMFAPAGTSNVPDPFS